MRTFNCENGELVVLLNVLEGIIVKKGRVKRGKAKLYKALANKFSEYQEDFKSIQDEYLDMDKAIENEKIPFKKGVDKDDFDCLINELHKDEVVINLVEHESKIKCFFEALEADEFDSAETLNDIHFDTLYDKLEQVFKIEKEQV